jgi:ribonucleoside-triphosphate reductase (thioredoxin)
VFDALEASGSGEPGFFWTDDPDMGTNPCAEIALHHQQFCNLTTINAGDVEDQHDLEERAWYAAILGTMQATFTDFHYLTPGWKSTTEREALIGVSMTGIASGKVADLDLERAANAAVAANAYLSRLLGINEAARVTTVKPEGTASIVLGTSSGIHAWHDRHYIRRIRLHKTEAMAQYLLSKLPYRREHIPGDPFPLEDDAFDADTVVLSVPQRAPKSAVTRDEGALRLLDRVHDFTLRWIKPGHRAGVNTNNVSTTVNVQDHEWEAVREWMFRHRYDYNGISILPYDGGTYVQAPFESTDADTYERLAAMFVDIDPREIDETADHTTLSGELACSGGACEITFA